MPSHALDDASGLPDRSITGILLAVAIVHVKALQKALMPWIIASQTVPILAVAPIVVVVLGNIASPAPYRRPLISAYLCFFPVTIGMVKGLTSPDLMLTDLMRTYYASPNQTFWKLRWPASVPFLFASLKVAIAISLVGAIVAELPTGAQAGLGARLLAGFVLWPDRADLGGAVYRRGTGGHRGRRRRLCRTHHDPGMGGRR